MLFRCSGTSVTAGKSDAVSSWRVRSGSDTREVDDENELRSLAERGELRPEHYVFDPKAQRWIYARELPFLDQAFRAEAVRAHPDAWIVHLKGRYHAFDDIAGARGWAESGKITRSTLIRHPILQQWMRGGEILELSDAFDAAPRVAPRAEASRARASDTLILAALVVAVAAIIAALAFFARSDDSPSVAQRPTASTTTSATEVSTAPAAPPKMYDYRFGVKADNVTVESSTAPAAGAPTGAAQPAPSATAAVVAVPPATTHTDAASEPAEAAAEDAPRARRDDAEEDEFSDDGDVVFKPTDSVRATVSGDTRVYIDRAMRDTRYHVAGCTYVHGGMSAVSLDLARQSYTPCDVCKPPR